MLVVVPELRVHKAVCDRRATLKAATEDRSCFDPRDNPHGSVTICVGVAAGSCDARSSIGADAGRGGWRALRREGGGPEPCVAAENSSLKLVRSGR